jgi:hypothetical protein
MRLIQLVCILLLAPSLGGCATSRWQATQQGRKDATKELESGVMAIEIFGYHSAQPPPFEKYLSVRGVQVRLVGACMPTDKIVGHALGFNQVMMEGMKKKLGEDIFVRAGYTN